MLRENSFFFFGKDDIQNIECLSITLLGNSRVLKSKNSIYSQERTHT